MTAPRQWPGIEEQNPYLLFHGVLRALHQESMLAIIEKEPSLYASCGQAILDVESLLSEFLWADLDLRTGTNVLFTGQTRCSILFPERMEP